MAGVSSEAYTINVENAGYCLVTANTKTSYTASTKKKLDGTQEANLALQLAAGKTYGDGVIKSNISRVTGATLKINLTKIPIEDRAAILGQTYAGGVLSCKGGDSAPLIAFYYEMTSDVGTKEQVWLFAGVAQPIGKTVKQIEENITFSNDEITIEFKPRKLDKKVFDFGDTANPDFTEALSTAFEATPPQSV